MDQPSIPTFNQLNGPRPAKQEAKELLGPTVLIADASSLFRRNLGTILQQEGYRLLYAETGADAIGLCAKERPDLVILETELPGISGIAVCQALKERLGLDDIYVFLTLGQEREDTYRAAHAAGANRVLHKPVEIEPLVETISSMLVPLPSPAHPLTITSLEGRRSCHVTGWKPRARGLTLEPGPEFEWLGGNLQLGVKVHVEYVAEDGARIIRAGTLRQVWKKITQKVLEIGFGKEIQRMRPTQFIHQPMPLQVKYESPAGGYIAGSPVNLSGGGIRLADLQEQLQVGDTIPLFLLRATEVLFSLTGEVKGTKIQPDGRFEASFSFTAMSSDTEKRLSQTLFRSDPWA